MKKYFKRLVYIEGDPTKQLIDLLVFLAYFSVSLYAGGFAYSLSYYSRFAIDTSILLSEQQFITLFVTKVILENFLIALISVCLSWEIQSSTSRSPVIYSYVLSVTRDLSCVLRVIWSNEGQDS